MTSQRCGREAVDRAVAGDRSRSEGVPSGQVSIEAPPPTQSRPPATSIPLVDLSFELRTVSASNAREHYMARHRRVSRERGITGTLVRGHLRAAGYEDGEPVVVTLVRLAPSSGLDDDNLRGSLKAVRDGTADALRMDDRDARIEWRYEQRRSRRRGAYAVEVRIERKA